MDDLVFRRAGKTDLPHILAMQADISTVSRASPVSYTHLTLPTTERV